MQFDTAIIQRISVELDRMGCEGFNTEKNRKKRCARSENRNPLHGQRLTGARKGARFWKRIESKKSRKGRN